MDGKDRIEFEQAVTRLEEIVEALESGKEPLNRSMQLFEEGIKLVRQCSGELDEAQGKLEVLVKNSQGQITTELLEV